MAANDEFPRGWDLASAVGVGATPGAGLLATPGITHILTSVTMVLVVTAVVAANAATVTVQLGTAASPSVFVWGVENNAPPGQQLSFGWIGKLVAPAGQLLFVSSNGVVPTGTTCTFEIQGYDI